MLKASFNARPPSVPPAGSGRESIFCFICSAGEKKHGNFHIIDILGKEVYCLRAEIIFDIFNPFNS